MLKYLLWWESPKGTDSLLIEARSKQWAINQALRRFKCKKSELHIYSHKPKEYTFREIGITQPEKAKASPKTLYKTTIVVWTDFDPTEKMELADLAREATDGSAYCSTMRAERVKDPTKDKDWDGTEFFNT